MRCCQLAQCLSAHAQQWICIVRGGISFERFRRSPMESEEEKAKENQQRRSERANNCVEFADEEVEA